MIVAVIILGVLVLGLAAVIVWTLTHSQGETGNALLLKADMAELTKSMGALKDGLQKQLQDQANVSAKQLQTQSTASIRILEQVTEKLTKLEGTNKNVGDIAAELKTLQNVLQNPKQRGVIGEYYLEQILKNTLPPGSFALQHRLGEGLVVDAVIKYDDKLLPVDSKFSLENYNRMIEAKDGEREVLEKAFKTDIKNRIDETSKYIKPGKGTLDQALMFIPSETIYYDILTEKVGISGRNLLAYAAEKKVTIVGPTTLSAILQTIAQGLRSIEIHKDTEKIRKNIEQLQKHLINHNGYMQKLGASLGTTVGHFNTTYKELGKIDRDIVKIADTDPSVEPLLLDKPALSDD
ncbi:MAG TPA: DNA recombination protein RmuC [Candidatus Saccharimonadales bacterium]|nr:DNA recombination protein RmuC [Candidatus Saccharimonadales bacterium]